MNEMIIRLMSNKDDAEILERQGKKEYFRKVDADELVSGILEIRDREKCKKPILLTDSIVGYAKGCILIKQDGAKRMVLYNGKSYHVNFPNALYFIYTSGEMIEAIKAFCYKRYEGAATELYTYTMPNMLNENRICVGNAKRKIMNENYVDALNTIIDTPFSHATLSGIGSFVDTVTYFNYLENNPFPYDLLKPLNQKLKGLVKTL